MKKNFNPINLIYYDKKIFYLFLIFFISRIFYYKFFNIEFDGWTIITYWQFFPKDLLQTELIESILYNHYQPPFLNLLVGSLMKLTEKYILILNFLYLFFGLSSFILIYLICNKLRFSKNSSFLISVILMILPTTILYENHLYKEYLTFFFLVWLFYFTLKIQEEANSLKNVLNIALSLSLLCITRETFHIFWGYILILFIQKNFSFSKKIILVTIFTIIVLPFYLKNLILFNKFAINAGSTFEHLSQKIDYVKEMEDPKRHEKIRQLIIGTYNDYQNFKKKTSMLYDVPINSNAESYKDLLNYKYKFNNKLLHTNTMYNEVWFEVNELRKKDYFLILKEYPSLLILNYLNSTFRHLFFSSDYFNFTKHNADKMKLMIKISDCIKLTPICVYDYGFNWNTGYIDGTAYETMNTGPLNYKEKIIYSLQYTNFLLVIIYLSLLIFLFKGLFSKKSGYEKMINFWLFTFIFIFASFVIFEDGEICRHRFPFDYLCFLIFLKNLKSKFLMNKFKETV